MNRFIYYMAVFSTTLLSASCNGTDLKVTYISNKEITTIKPDWKGNMTVNGRFQNDSTQAVTPPLWPVIKWKLSANPQKKEKKADKFALSIDKSTPFERGTRNVINWLGHSSFLINIEGATMITDPCFYDLPFNKRVAGLPCSLDSLYADYILISHNHRDHFDQKSIERIIRNNPHVHLIIPLGLGERVKPMTKHYTEMGWYQQLEMGNLQLSFLPAAHWTRSNLTDFNKSLWGSYMIQSSGMHVYFGGDTGWGDHFHEIASLFNKVDIALLPIGAYSPQWLMAKEHINPEEAVKAAQILNAKVTIPMHYGTYDLSDEPLGEPLERFQAACKQAELNYAKLDLGTSFSIVSSVNEID